MLTVEVIPFQGRHLDTRRLASHPQLSTRRQSFSPVFRQPFSLSSRGRAPSISLTRRWPLRSRSRRLILSESQAAAPRRRQLFVDSEGVHTRTPGRMRHVTPTPPVHGFLPSRGTIVARNLRIINPSSFSGRNRPTAASQASASTSQVRGGQAKDNMGVISIDDVVALANTISKLRANAQSTSDKLQKKSQASNNTNNSTSNSTAPEKAANAHVGVSGPAMVLTDSSAARVIIADPGVVAVDPVSHGVIALGPPGITTGVQIPAGTPSVGSGTSMVEIIAPLALLQSNGNERRTLANHLMSDPIFLSELEKAANNKNVPIDVSNLATLLRNGAADTGNPEQNKMINSLLETTYKNMLEEILENMKKRLMKQVEAKHEARVARQQHQRPTGIIIAHV